MAPAIHFQAVAFQLKLMQASLLLQHPIDITAQEVLRQPTFGTYQVMVVPPVTQLIMQATVFKQYSTQDACFHQQAETTVHGSPAHSRKLPSKLFRREVPVPRRHGSHQRLSGCGTTVAPVLYDLQQLVCF